MADSVVSLAAVIGGRADCMTAKNSAPGGLDRCCFALYNHREVTAMLRRISDGEAKKVIERIAMSKNATEFQALQRPKRDAFIGQLKAEGLSVRQISRLTGISKGIVERVR